MNICEAEFSVISANTKHLYNIYTTSARRPGRWISFVWMLYTCLVFAGVGNEAELYGSRGEVP